MKIGTSLLISHDYVTKHEQAVCGQKKSVCVCVCTDLLPSVDDVLCIRQSVDTGPSYNGVVSRGGVGHFHGAELKKRLTQRHSAEQHLPEMQTHRMTLSMVRSHKWTYTVYI